MYSMNNKTVKYLKYSQYSFFGSLTICFLLVPKVATGNLGISYFGNHLRTILPYLIGLLMTSYFIIKAANTLERPNHTLHLLDSLPKIVHSQTKSTHAKTALSVTKVLKREEKLLATKRDLHRSSILSEALIVLALLIISVLLTPYTVNTLFDKAHIFTSSVLFFVELGIAIWLVFITNKNLKNISLLAMQIIGAMIALMSLSSNIELMLTGQLVAQLAFGFLLINTVDELTR